MKSIVKQFIKDQTNRIIKPGFIVHDNMLMRTVDDPFFTIDSPSCISYKISDDTFILFKDHYFSPLIFKNTQLIEKEKHCILLSNKNRTHQLLFWKNILITFKLKGSYTIDDLITKLTNNQISEIRNYEQISVNTHSVELEEFSINNTLGKKDYRNYKSLFYNQYNYIPTVNNVEFNNNYTNDLIRSVQYDIISI